jgi:hypothetical protein
VDLDIAMANHLAERRLIIRVRQIWLKAAGTSNYPRRSQIDPTELGRDWANCVMIDLDEAPARSRFSYVGSALRDLCSPTFERQFICECLEGSLLELATRQVPQVVEEKKVLSFAGSAIHQDVNILYRSILLPLSENGTKIDGILAAIGYREIAVDQGFHITDVGPVQRATSTSDIVERLRPRN